MRSLNIISKKLDSKFKWRALGLASVIGMVLSGCASDEAPPPPPPPPSTAPAVNLSTTVSDEAAVYVSYVNMARNMSADFPTGASIQEKLASGTAFEPKQLARGAVAYAAIVAMQDPDFRNSIRAYATNSAARADLVARIYANPQVVSTMPGTEATARRIIATLSNDGESIFQAGARVKQSAYDVQKQSWSREFIPGRDERLNRAKSNSVSLRSVDQGESSRLLASALSGEGIQTSTTPSGADAAVNAVANSGNPAAKRLLTQSTSAGFDRESLFKTPYTYTVHNALAIAALSLLGEGNGRNEQMVSHLLDDNTGPTCLGLTKLNLYQCLSVAKPHYEDIFCIGQHVLMDTGQCIGKMSSYALSADTAATVAARMEKVSSSERAYIQPTKSTKSKKAVTKGKTTASSGAKASTKKKK